MSPDILQDRDRDERDEPQISRLIILPALPPLKLENLTNMQTARKVDKYANHGCYMALYPISTILSINQ